MNGLEFIHLTSFCTVQRIMEATNSPHPPVHSHFPPRWVCNNMKKVKNANLMFAIQCISQDVTQEGDTSPLDADVINKRIAASAGEFVNNFSNKDKCLNIILENLSYEEAKKKFKKYDHCIYKEILTYLAIGDMLTEPNFNSEKNAINYDYYSEYALSDPNADYRF